MFKDLTAAERDELRRVLSWVLAATQSSEAQRDLIRRAIETLRAETPVVPSEIEEV